MRGRQKLVTALLRRIRWFERFSRPRASRLFEALLGAIGVATILAIGEPRPRKAQHVL